MKLRSLIYTLSIFFITLVGCSRAFDYPEAKVTVKVVDEYSNPLENVDVLIGFQEPKSTAQGIKDVAEKGVTRTDGIFSASRKSGNHIAFSAEKQGYYKSRGDFHFSTSTNGRWQPWNQEIKLVLRKIEKPVPMYAREFRRELPVIGKEAGFDLIEYDWVAPYGKGVRSDVVFKLQKQIKSRDEFEGKLTINLPGKFDGIQLLKDDRKKGSDFKLPRFAPEVGYRSEIVLSRKREIGKPLESSYKQEHNYIFRIRSEEKEGKLIRAMYGKIQGDISFDAMRPSDAVVVFRYYLNPDYSKNLEFDMMRNLFINLEDSEKIGLY